jgi:hypothetical protein
VDEPASQNSVFEKLLAACHALDERGFRYATSPSFEQKP